MDGPQTLTAGSPGDTVKIFDIPGDSADPLTLLQCTPPAGLSVNSVGWNHFTSVLGLQNSGGSASRSDISSLPIIDEVTAATSCSSTMEETPCRNRELAGGALSKLHGVQTDDSFKDDMDVFSPLLDVRPITPLSNWSHDHDEAKNDYKVNDKKPSLFLHSALPQSYAYSKDWVDVHSSLEIRSDTSPRQEGTQGVLSQSSVTPSSTLHSDQAHAPTPPEHWGADESSDVLAHNHNEPDLASSHILTSGSFVARGKLCTIFQGLHLRDSVNLPAAGPLTKVNSKAFHPQVEGIYCRQTNHESSGSLSLETTTKLPYLERIGADHCSGDGTISSEASPKWGKAGMATREACVNDSLFSKTSMVTMIVPKNASTTGVGNLSTTGNKSLNSVEEQHGTPSFTLQLVQRNIEEALGSLNKTNHEDMRNLHIELLRQFHVLEAKINSIMNTVLENQVEMMKKIEALQKENQQLRQLL